LEAVPSDSVEALPLSWRDAIEAGRGAELSEGSVEAEPNLELPRSAARLLVYRDVEVDEAYEMRRDLEQDLALPERFGHEPEVE
jgi:hypothetical protein